MHNTTKYSILIIFLCNAPLLKTIILEAMLAMESFQFSWGLKIIRWKDFFGSIWSPGWQSFSDLLNFKLAWHLLMFPTYSFLICPRLISAIWTKQVCISHHRNDACCVRDKELHCGQICCDVANLCLCNSCLYSKRQMPVRNSLGSFDEFTKLLWIHSSILPQPMPSHYMSSKFYHTPASEHPSQFHDNVIDL